MKHNPNCAIVRLGSIRAWCDCGIGDESDHSKNAMWHGGNKIPDSYLRKFQQSVEDEEIPYEIRLFLDGISPEKKDILK